MKMMFSVEENPPLVGCELESLEEEIMKRDKHNLDVCVPLFQNKERFGMIDYPNPIIIEDIHEPPSFATRKVEIKRRISVP